MPRIRTIKPEFWTDEKVVQLPFEARLLFIGMWNFADDSGSLPNSPERIKMQVLPADTDVDADDLIDLLIAAGLVEVWVSETSSFLKIIGWDKHQKIDNPSRSIQTREGYRKLAITGDVRIGVARKYGCSPGSSADADCYYCGSPGKVHWWLGVRGKPTKWVTLSGLEFDHFYSEYGGGETTEENIVLACRECNRGKREFDPHHFVQIKNRVVLDRTREPSIALGLEEEEEEEEDKDNNTHVQQAANAAGVCAEILEEWNSKMGQNCRLTTNRSNALKQRLRDPLWVENWREAIDRAAKSDFMAGNGPNGWRADFEWFVRPDSLTKILEGKFDNRNGKPQTVALRKAPTFEEFDL